MLGDALDPVLHNATTVWQKLHKKIFVQFLPSVAPKNHFVIS